MQVLAWRIAPLPGLVTLGHDRDDRVHLITVMANLGAIGVIALGGDTQAARETVAAAAVELATATWSQQARILLVGFGHDEGLGRLEPVPTASLSPVQSLRHGGSLELSACRRRCLGS